MFPGGWRNKEDDAGHLLIHMLERNQDGKTFRFSTHNAGKGSEYHQSTNMCHPSEAIQSTFVLESLSEEQILDEGFWYMFFMLQSRKSDKHSPEMVYELLLPHLAG